MSTMSRPTSDRRPPTGIPSLALKLNVATAPLPQIPQPSFSTPSDPAWNGNVGTKRYFLGTLDAEGLGDEELYQLFLQKEGEIFAAKNSRTPFQYIKTSGEAAARQDALNPKEAPEPLQPVKDDPRDMSYEAWAAQMTSLVLLRKEEQRSKQPAQ